MPLNEDVQNFSPGAIVTLYELDLTKVDPVNPILRFTASTDGAGAPIIFDSKSYAPIPVQSEGWEYSSVGQIPRPLIRISNVTNVVSSALLEFDDLIGIELRRIRTFETYLDGGDTPDPTQKFEDELWLIDRKTIQNSVFVEWELASPMDQQGKKLPGRQILKTSCTHVYRTFDPAANGGAGGFTYTRATCPFSDDNVAFTRAGDSTTPSNDVCGKRLVDCKLRFGEFAVLPIEAFPATGDVR